MGDTSKDARFDQLVRDMGQPAQRRLTEQDIREINERGARESAAYEERRAETLARMEAQQQKKFMTEVGTCIVLVLLAWFVLRWLVKASAARAKQEQAWRDQMGRVHGSARWMTSDDLKAHKMIGSAAGPGDLLIGVDGSNDHVIYWGENGHMLTFAPTGAGKGVSSLIPNLLMYPGSVVVIDPKGENAFVTARRRRELGQAVHILDPFGKVADKYPSAAFNPLDWIDAAGDEAAEDVALLAEALAPADGKGDPFWNNEGRAMIAGLLLYIAAHEPPEQRNLGRLRDLLSLHPDEWRGLLDQMGESPYPLVRSAGNRIAQKPEKEMASVLSTAQSHTHFLDSAKVRAVLSKTTVDFRTLKKEPASIFLVLPAEQLQNQGRWLRLMITALLRAMARDEAPAPGEAGKKIIKPKFDVLFLLDEFAALGHLNSIKQAFGLMRGYGLKLWPILQDLPQLQGLYKDDWQTFIANAGAIQVFGTNDRATAEYVSKQIGTETVDTASKTYSQHGASESTGLAGRPLMMPDEVMRIEKGQAIVLLRGLHPMVCRRIIYYSDDTFKPHADPNPYAS